MLTSRMLSLHCILFFRPTMLLPKLEASVPPRITSTSKSIRLAIKHLSVKEKQHVDNLYSF